ncbi:MAG: hypothetical protein D9V47_14105 [Clostridia bacterium]|nr:MAG: hypothetical protein D9V47_14105 [Clostridia bacterium]
MTDQERNHTLEKLATIRRLVAEVRKESGLPVIEAMMRICEGHVKWAQWSLAEGERYQFELD